MPKHVSVASKGGTKHRSEGELRGSVDNATESSNALERSLNSSPNRTGSAKHDGAKLTFYEDSLQGRHGQLALFSDDVEDFVSTVVRNILEQCTSQLVAEGLLLDERATGQ